jgi:hypothetical protein
MISTRLVGRLQQPLQIYVRADHVAVFADPENVPTYAATGTSRSIVSNRVSVSGYGLQWTSHRQILTYDPSTFSTGTGPP